jgi:hypothetical protein
MVNKAQKRIGGLRRNQQLLYIGIFTLVAVVVWVAGNLFQSQNKTGISRELQLMALPLNPNINTFVIDRIEQKTTYEDQDLQDFEIFVIDIEAKNQANSVQQQTQQPSLLPLVSPAENPEQTDSNTSEQTPGIDSFL